MYSLRLSPSFDVNKKLSLQTFGIYRSSTELLQIKPYEFWFVNTGTRYNILNAKDTKNLI